MDYCAPVLPRPKKESSTEIQNQDTLDCICRRQWRDSPIVYPTRANCEYLTQRSCLKAFTGALHTCLHQMYRSRKCSLLKDNAHLHTAIPLHKLLDQFCMNFILHPTYLPDLAPTYLFLFLLFKGVIEVRCFADIPDIWWRVTSVLWSIPKEAFTDSFRQLYQRCIYKWIVVYGYYFEVD